MIMLLTLDVFDVGPDVRMSEGHSQSIPYLTNF